jgi:hypothetical protein
MYAIRFILTLFFTLTICNLAKNIGVCISGQIARLVIDSIIDKVIIANPNHRFYIFFSLQSTEGLSSVHSRYSYFVTNSYHISRYAKMNESQAINVLKSNFSSISNVYHTNVYLRPFYSKEQVTSIFKLKNLDRLKHRSYNSDVVMNIANMYINHWECGKQFRYYQRSNRIRFDYSILTRDDLFVFKPINLNYVFEYMQQKNVDEVSKDCQHFSGINQRFQVFREPAGTDVLFNKIALYYSLYRKKLRLSNTEKFELYALTTFSYNYTDISVEKLPVAAVRLAENESICFSPNELLNKCYPQYYEDFMHANVCRQ